MFYKLGRGLGMLPNHLPSPPAGSGNVAMGQAYPPLLDQEAPLDVFRHFRSPRRGHRAAGFSSSSSDPPRRDKKTVHHDASSRRRAVRFDVSVLSSGTSSANPSQATFGVPALAAVLAARTPTICGLQFHDRHDRFPARASRAETRTVASTNIIQTREPLDDIPDECSSVVTPAHLPLSVTAMRATAHSVSSARRPPHDVPAEPLSAISSAHRLQPGTSTGGVTGSRHLEDSRVVLLPTDSRRRDEGRRRDDRRRSSDHHHRRNTRRRRPSSERPSKTPIVEPPVAGTPVEDARHRTVLGDSFRRLRPPLSPDRVS